MKDALIFIAGAGIGSLITYELLKDKYKKIADEEIKSVKEIYARDYEPKVKTLIKDNNQNENIPAKEKVEEAKNESSQEDDEPVEFPVEPFEEKIAPYPISSLEFGEYNDYNRESYVYCTEDNALVDVDGSIVDEVEEKIGDCLNRFTDIITEYDEDDDLYVRNENNKTDYEIIKTETTSEHYKESNGLNKK